MREKIKDGLSRIGKSGVTKTFIGFLSFIIAAAILMLFLEAPEAGSGIKDLFASLWFAIVTVTTVGYGDLSPVSALGKIAAIVIMFIGVLYIGVITGNITSWLVERNRRRVFGLVPIRKKEGHLLILGWRQGMSDILKDILRLHNKTSTYLVLVNGTNIKEVNELRQDPELKELSYFSGDYTNKEVLQNACCATASKVLVFSDEYSGLTSDEIDFKTVLATIAVKRLNPQIYAIVEIIQPKFGLYLQHVEVEEIILSRLSARALLSNITLMSGLNNVFTTFFSMQGGLLKIEEIESRYVGKTYQELKQNYSQYLVIGLIENRGNLRQRKQEKMRSIPKSVSIQKAIEEIENLKTISSNFPIFHPSPSFVIKENSGVIILKVDAHELNACAVSNETIVTQSFDEETIDSFLGRHLQNSIAAAEDWNQLVGILKTLDIEFYQYGNQINGLIYQNLKHPFQSLKLPEKVFQEINSIYEKKRNRKEWVQLKFNEYLKTSYDWEDFFLKLNSAAMELYFYRNKPNGIIFEGKKFSFKTLGLANEIIEEIVRVEGLITKPDDLSKAELGKKEYPSLQALLNDLNKKKMVFKPHAVKDEKILIICGWKPQLLEMIYFIIEQFPKHKAYWNKISVVADISDENASKFNAHFNENVAVHLYQGSVVDRDVLKAAGIAKATKVIILAETESGKSFEAIDSQTVLAAMLISSLNKKAYKVAEILDKRYKESLEQANVEEIYLEDEFTRIMLSNGSHGVGITRVISEMVNFKHTIFNTRNVSEEFINGSFRQLIRKENKPGELIIGLLEETGNIHVRKSERIHQAQIQSNIKGQVEELIKVKELIPNRVVIAPDLDYTIPPHSKLISLKSSDQNGWKYYQSA